MVVVAIIGWFIHPIFGWVGNIFEALSSLVSSVPESVLQVVIAVLCVGTSAFWIRGFLNTRRTPAGLAKLTDDDYFRMIFAGVGGVLGAFFFLVLWPGLSSWMINSTSDLFEVLGNKFGNGRSGRPLDVDLPNIVQTGKFPNYGPSGLNFSIGFAAVFFGVVFYTAAFVAEIVRGGILAVPKYADPSAMVMPSCSRRAVSWARRFVFFSQRTVRDAAPGTEGLRNWIVRLRA